MDQIGKPIGSADRDQIASAIYSSAEIVTNDGPFTEVAEALEVTVHSAELIVIEAFSQGILTKDQVKKARELWKLNGEKPPSTIDKKELDRICG